MCFVVLDTLFLQCRNFSFRSIINLFNIKFNSMKRKINLLLVLLLFGVGLVSAQQNLSVSGVVTSSSDDSPMIGVSVLVKGTAKGTISDINGKYSVSVPQGSTLVFSYIGMEKKEVVVKSNVVNVELRADSKMLDEVVAIGYGSSKRSTLTTSQTTVSSKQMEKTQNTTLEQAIQGRTAGVYITQNSGQPGGGISVAVRGVASLNGSTEPLYVIDGVQMEGQSISYGSTSSSNPLAGLNPSDVADIQILQGPSATALYGSRATNGVLLITTKRGKAGEAKISYNYGYTLQTPPERMNLMKLSGYAQVAKEYAAITYNHLSEEFLDPSILGDGTDWQKEMFRNSAMNKHQISVSGGSDKSTYYVSGEYLKQEGVAIGSGFDRFSFRANLDNKPRKWLKMSVNTSFNQTKEKLTNSSENIISNALQLSPQVPVTNFDGTYGGGDDTNGNDPLKFSPVNPIAIANSNINSNLRRQFNGGAAIDVDIMKGLTFKSTLDGNIGTQNSIYYVPKMKIGWYNVELASLSDYNSVSTYWNWNQRLQYNKQIGKHNFDLMVSHESQESAYKGNGATRTTFLTNDIIDLNAGDPETATNSGGHNSSTLESYLGRFVYNFEEKYIVNATVRTDGSSRFGQNNKWGSFPAISAAWRVSKEKWYKLDVMNEFKIRVETGLTGNCGWMNGTYSPMNNATSQWGAGFLPSKYANPDLKWEQTKTNNFGFNAAFFKNRLQIEFDYYHKLTDNLLMDAILPYYMGTNGTGAAGAPMVNLGSMQNNGWGLTVNFVNVDTKDFKWESNFNISGFKTKITKLNTDNAHMDRTSWWMNDWTQRAVVGESPWLFLGYKTAGIFQSEEEINNSAVPADNNGVKYPTNASNIWVGDVKYVDVSGPNGTPDGVINVYDRTTIGNPWPKLFGGFSNTFSYKGFDLSVLLTFSYGNDIYNYTKMINSNAAQINLGRNVLASAGDYAHLATDKAGLTYITNAGATLPRITNSNINGNWSKFSDMWVEDGSYIKVKNISLAYNVPNSLIKKQSFVTGVRVMLSAQNLFTLTHYTGYDPEVGAYVGKDASASNQAIGMDNGRYPLTRMYSFNIAVNF
jgi:TonB-linked SusC/RagA family outer membrane protein